MLNLRKAIFPLCTILFLLIFCPRGVQAQEGLNGTACAPCSDTTATEAQFRDTTVSMTDVVPGCTVSVEFSMRKCGLSYDLNIKKVTLTVTNSTRANDFLGSVFSRDAVNLAIGALLYRNPMRYPPYGKPQNERYNWRVVRPACWSYNGATKTYAPCAGSSCCFALLAAYYNGCDDLTLQSGFQRSQRPPCPNVSGSPTEGGGPCMNTCSDDLLGDYMMAQRRNGYLESR